MNATNIRRQALRSFIRDIRECRIDQSIPMMVGQGYTIAVKSTGSAIARKQEVAPGAYNFEGSWNRKTSYWTQQDAAKIAAKLRVSRPELELEVVHRNDLRDRTLATALQMVRFLWPARNA
jgi:hypothetical protein